MKQFEIKLASYEQFKKGEEVDYIKFLKHYL